MLDLLTTAQLAERLGVSERWIQREVANGSLPHYRLGRARRLLRFDAEQVRDWLADNAPTGEDAW